MLSVQKSTVHNILSTFEELGYVSQNAQTDKYSLGLKMLRFSYIINSHLDYREIFLPYIHRIAQEMNEVCYLGIPYGASVLYLEAAYPSSGANTRSITGRDRAHVLHGPGQGLMLAFLPEEEREAVIQSPKEKCTDCTILDPGVLRDNLEEVRVERLCRGQHGARIRRALRGGARLRGRTTGSSPPSACPGRIAALRPGDGRARGGHAQRIIKPLQHRL